MINRTCLIGGHMETNRVLMVFEELIKTLLTKQSSLISQHLRIHNLPSGILLTWDNLMCCSSFQEWMEKYQRTWWEVLWFVPESSRQEWTIKQCVYIADSLSDAIRLRPHLSISFQSFSPAQLEDAFEDIGDWEEDLNWNKQSEIEPNCV